MKRGVGPVRPHPPRSAAHRGQRIPGAPLSPPRRRGASAVPRPWTSRPSRRARGRVVAAEGADASRVRLQRKWDGSRCQARVKNRDARRWPWPRSCCSTCRTCCRPRRRSTARASRCSARPAAPSASRRPRRLHGREALPDAPARGRDRRPTACSRSAAPGEGQRRAGVHLLPAVRRPFQVRPARCAGRVDTEGLTLGPRRDVGARGVLLLGPRPRGDCSAGVGERIAAHHARCGRRRRPPGWCSWYCFGPRVTASRCSHNLDVIAREVPGCATSRSTTATSPPWATGWRRGPPSAATFRACSKQIRDARLRARDLGRAVHRREGLPRLPGSPRLVREGRRGPAAAARTR